ncbi:unnamed protein product [Triticum turgidum subsp. durum]|uniref:Uncharacterized protein n=1 Tax=Triticum turgidum subsp. durum TaxID=4567 RepID=A0A9R0SQK1_TRITD|nr:unnamed protein product [Triticum turgidum subsp. durum]
MALEDYVPRQWQVLATTLLLAMLLLPLLSMLLVAAARASPNSTGTRNKLPPHPPGLPILGNLHQMGALPHRSLWEMAQRHGPVMMLRLGTVPTLVVSSAGAARDVLKTHDADCCSRPDTPGPRRLSYQHNDVAFNPYSEQWRERRKLLVVEFLSKRRIQATWYARETEVGKLVSGLAVASMNEQEPVCLEDHVFGYMDGIVGTVAFGNMYGTEHFAHKEHFHHVIDEAMVVRSSFSAEDYFPNTLGRLVDRLTGVASLREMVFKEFDAFFEMMLGQAKPDNAGCVGLIDVLIRLMKERQQGSFTVSRDVVKGLLTV